MKFPAKFGSKSKVNSKVNIWRYRFVLIFLAVAALALLWRMLDLMVINRGFLMQQGNARMVRVVSTQAYRGMITDRYGNPLAISTPVDAVWADPQTVTDVDAATLAKLARIIALPQKTLNSRLQQKHKEFIYLQRQLTPLQAAEVKALNIPGIFLKREYRRYYPEGEVTAHVVGLTNVDDHGQEGLELADEKTLQGVAGQRRVIKDRMGYVVAEVNELREPKAGENIALSIDRRIQYSAYRALAAGITKYNAKSGSAVVMDVHTGEILAMVSQPGFNPNNRPKGQSEAYRNRAVTDTFEPGSTIKTFSIITALESGKYKPNTMINTSPGWYMIGKNMVHDHSNKGEMTVTDVLKFSSNVGVSKIILSLPPENLWNLLNKLGLGQSTGSGFPGEVVGVLPYREKWAPFALATLSFGYGLSVTTLQLAHIYSTLANEGISVPPTFLKVTTPPQGEQMIDPKTTHETIKMLETVVEPGGTAPWARVPGYWISGKTGTSFVVGPKGYDKKHKNVVFVGIAPATNPQLVVVVFLHDPKPKAQTSDAGYTAGPIFSKIMSESLRILNIPPDHLNGGAQTGEQQKPAAEELG